MVALCAEDLVEPAEETPGVVVSYLLPIPDGDAIGLDFKFKEPTAKVDVRERDVLLADAADLDRLVQERLEAPFTDRARVGSRMQKMSDYQGSLLGRIDGVVRDTGWALFGGWLWDASPGVVRPRESAKHSAARACVAGCGRVIQATPHYIFEGGARPEDGWDHLENLPTMLLRPHHDNFADSLAPQMAVSAVADAVDLPAKGPTPLRTPPGVLGQPGVAGVPAPASKAGAFSVSGGTPLAPVSEVDASIASASEARASASSVGEVSPAAKSAARSSKSRPRGDSKTVISGLNSNSSASALLGPMMLKGKTQKRGSTTKSAVG